MKGFPVEFSREGRFVRAQAIDLPRAFAVGTSIDHALRQMRNSIDRALHYHVKEGRPLPAPSAARGRPAVRPGPVWRYRIAREHYRHPGGPHMSGLAAMLHSLSPWTMPAFHSLVPCTLMLA